MLGKKEKDLLESLVQYPVETEWIEFKESYFEPEHIGERISGLANSANLAGQPFGYLVFGVDDKEHNIVGTSFNFSSKKVGNEDFEIWLNQRFSPRCDIRVTSFEYLEKKIVMFCVPAATDEPVKFMNESYIRIGSITKKLKENPAKERRIWVNSEKFTYEKALAEVDLSTDQVLNLLDYPSYFSLTEKPLPTDREKIIQALLEERIIVQSENGYGITNMGAILFAKKLNQFESLKRKSPRLIVYRGVNKAETFNEVVGTFGYAVGFPRLVEHLLSILPANEILRKAFRVEEKMYPEKAIRELIANSLIHQDFVQSGTGPMIEVFLDRIEITNPGKPLIKPIELIGHTPRSRNEKIAYLMRQMRFCEERGSGIIKVVELCEMYQLPAPKFEEIGESFRVTLFAPKPFSEMDKQDKIRACFQHCCLQYASNQYMTNESLRKRLGIKKENYTSASRIIEETLKENLIKVYDPNSSSKKYSKYIPIWA